MKSGAIPSFPAGIIPCTMSAARMVLSCFPLESMHEDGKLHPGDAANLLLPLTQWGMDNPDRLVLTRMLLEGGCDANDLLSGLPWSDWHTLAQSESALHIAAERGDEAMVDLLIEFGARGDSKGRDQDTAAERALSNGHTHIAAKLEAIKG